MNLLDERAQLHRDAKIATHVDGQTQVLADEREGEGLVVITAKHGLDVVFNEVAVGWASHEGFLQYGEVYAGSLPP